jgi:hypothetical protein
MRTLSLPLDPTLDAALEELCARKGQDKASLVADLIRRYVQKEQLQDAVQDPALGQLYQELAVEDVALAEAGMEEVDQMLREADES